jgi:DNA-binding response OmpR family regulator
MEATPVVFLTGMTETEAELQGLELGAVDYITNTLNWMFTQNGNWRI